MRSTGSDSLQLSLSHLRPSLVTAAYVADSHVCPLRPMKVVSSRTCFAPSIICVCTQRSDRFLVALKSERSHRIHGDVAAVLRVCSRPCASKSLRTLYKLGLETTCIAKLSSCPRGAVRWDFAAASAYAFGAIPLWLGVNRKTTRSILLRNLHIPSRSAPRSFLLRRVACTFYSISGESSVECSLIGG